MLIFVHFGFIFAAHSFFLTTEKFVMFPICVGTNGFFRMSSREGEEEIRHFSGEKVLESFQMEFFPIRCTCLAIFHHFMVYFKMTTTNFQIVLN